MDPDSTASTKQSFENNSHYDDNDFLKELFETETSIMDSVQPRAEYGAHAFPYSESQFVEKNSSNGHSFTNGHTLINGCKSLPDETSNKMDGLKQQVKELLEKNLLLESQVAQYESRLSQKLQEILNARMEIDTLRERAEFNERENASAELKLQQLEAQVYQFRELKISKDEKDYNVAQLQKEMAQTAKAHEKLKSKLESGHLLLTEKNNDIKKAKQNNKKLWNLLIRFGKKLNKARLLTDKEKACIVKEYDDENPIADDDLHEEADLMDCNEEADLTYENEESEEAVGSEASNTTPNVEQLQEAIETVPENNATFLQPYPVRQSPSSDREGLHFEQNIKNPRNFPSFHRPRALNCFSNTNREVLEDPQVSDDCMDVSVTELSAMRQQLGLNNGHFTPISPIPPTPPPKSNQSVSSQSKPSYALGNSNAMKASAQTRISCDQQNQQYSKLGIKSEPYRSRRLAFTHQQSEGFDVAGDPPNNLDENSQNALPKFSDSRNSSQKSSCRVLSKRQNDGCLKLQFNSLKPILFEVNYTTHDVTCTFPPVIDLDTPNKGSAPINSRVNSPTSSLSTPFRIPKFVKKEKKEPEETTCPVKRQRLSVEQDTYRLPNSNEAGTSRFVSYKRSGSLEGESHDANPEDRSFNFNVPSAVGGLFSSTPAASMFRTEESENNVYARDAMAGHIVQEKSESCAKEKSLGGNEIKSVVSSSCRSPFQFKEQSKGMLPDEHNLLTLQPNRGSPRITNPANEVINNASCPDNSTLINYKQQDIPNTVPAQSINDVFQYTAPIFGTCKADSEPTGYTSSESDSGHDYKPLNKRMGPLNYSNGTLRRRKKKPVNLGVSSNVAPVRTRGRTFQSHMLSGKAALEKSSKSDTNNKDQYTNEFQGTESEKTIIDSSTEGVRNGIDSFSESSVFKLPKRVSRVVQTKNLDFSFPPTAEESISDGPMNGTTTISTETHVMKCSNNNACSDFGTVDALDVGGINVEFNNQNTNLNQPLEQSVLKNANETKTNWENTGSSICQSAIGSEYYDTIKQANMQNSSADDKQLSETEHTSENILKKRQRMVKTTENIASTSAYPLKLDSACTFNNHENVKMSNMDEVQSEGDRKHQDVHKRTRSASQMDMECAAETDATNKSGHVFVEKDPKPSLSTDKELGELEQKSQGNPIRKRQKSKIIDSQNEAAIKCISSDETHDSSELNAEVRDEIVNENLRQSLSNENSVKNKVFQDGETIQKETAASYKGTIKADKQSDADEEERTAELSKQAWPRSSKHIKVKKSENKANPKSEKRSVSVNDVHNNLDLEEDSANSLSSEVKNSKDNCLQSASPDKVEPSILPDNSKKKIEEKNCTKIKLTCTASLKETNLGKRCDNNVTKQDFAPIKSTAKTPTKTKSFENAVLDQHSGIQEATLAIKRLEKLGFIKTIEEFDTNGTVIKSPSSPNALLHNNKTQCTIVKLQKDNDSTSLVALDTDSETTLSNSSENQNLNFVIKEDSTSVMNNNEISLKTYSKASEITVTPAKSGTHYIDLPTESRSQDYEMDFTQLDADGFYTTLETALDSDFTIASTTEMSNGIDKKENGISSIQNTEVDALFQENHNGNNCDTDLIRKSPINTYSKKSRKASQSTEVSPAPPKVLQSTKKSPTQPKVSQSTDLLHSPPSTDPIEKEVENSLSGSLSSNTKEIAAVSECAATTLTADSQLLNECKDENVLSDLNMIEVEVETSPRRILRTRSKSSTNTMNQPRMSASLNCCVLDDSSKISEIDSDHDSPLIIAEESLDTESHVEDVSPVKERTRKKPRKTRRKKGKSKLAVSRKIVKPEPNSVASVFQDIEKIKFTDEHSKIAIHNLVRVLIDPKNSPEAQNLVLHIIQHIHQTKRNPLITYAISHDATHFLPITEECIVSALFQIALKGKPQFNNLLETAVLTLYNMVFGKETSFSMFGQGALCRVLTEICKRQSNPEEPIKLCGELLKWEHQYAPFLIASMVGIWPEIFKPSNNKDNEQIIFYAAIKLGVKEKPDVLTHSQWKQCQAIFTDLLPVKATEDKHIPRNLKAIVHNIRCKCVDSVYDKEYLLTTPLVIYSRIKGWQWAKDALVDSFILRSLKKFSFVELNEIAFEFFLNLYAEMCFNYPAEENPYKLFWDYLHTDENGFIHFTAAIILMKLIMWKQDMFPEEISKWMVKWNNHPKVNGIVHLFKRRMMIDQDLCLTEIIGADQK